MQDKSIRKHAESKSGFYVLIALAVIGGIVELLFASWTASHNIPMMMQGVDDGVFKFFGGIGAVVGEVVSIAAFVFLFFTGGSNRVAVMATYLLMNGILLFNSIVRYAQLKAGNPMVDQVIGFYGSYVAPFPIFIVAILGVLAIVHTHPLLRQRTAEHNARAKELERQVSMQEWAAERMMDMMDDPDIHAELKRGAMAGVRALATKTAGQISGEYIQPILPPQTGGRDVSRNDFSVDVSTNPTKPR